MSCASIDTLTPRPYPIGIDISITTSSHSSLSNPGFIQVGGIAASKRFHVKHDPLAEVPNPTAEEQKNFLREKLPGLSKSQWELLESYVQLLQAEAMKTSLVSRKDLGLVWLRHVGDCLSPLWLERFPSAKLLWLDIGAGAGLPSIPLAITNPHWHMVALEIRPLKYQFLQQCKATLNLPNLDLERGNARVLGSTAGWIGRFDVVSTRAVGKIHEDAVLARPFLRPGGVFVTFKSSEHAGRIDGYHPPRYTPYSLPPLDNKLALVEMTRRDGA